MKKTVAHSIYPYLFITGSWIYSILTGIDSYDSLVITNNKVNTDIFPFNRIKSISDKSFLYKNYIRLHHKIYKNYSPFTQSVLKENNVAILHSHFGNIGWGDLRSKMKLKIPQLTTFYGYDISELACMDIWRKRYKALFQCCDLFTVEGNHMKDTLINIGCEESKIRVQHIGIDLDSIKFIPRTLGSDGIIKVLIAGSFREKKGIKYAVEAFARVKEKYKNIHLTIIGDGTTEKELIVKREIYDIINKYNMASSVNFLGYQPYSILLAEAQKHHIFISPSVQAENGDNEGGAPVTIIEMSASGMPVISTWHCDIPEVIINDKSGYLVNERNVDQLAERLEYLIENPEKWHEIGQHGRMHIERKYNIVTQVDKLTSIYNELLN